MGDFVPKEGRDRGRTGVEVVPERLRVTSVLQGFREVDQYILTYAVDFGAHTHGPS